MNIIEYAEKNMNRFDQADFNHVDSLLLSQLAYIYFGGVVATIKEEGDFLRIADLLQAEKMTDMLTDTRVPKENYELLLAMGMSPRFRDIKVGLYCEILDQVEQKQFAALTYLIDDERAYVAYRGTDSSFVGWKEDFNMAFTSPIPAQEESVRYLNSVASKIDHKLILGGHSKGGNLAVYSAMECQSEIEPRIIKIYSHDGPGFKEEIFDSDKYKKIEGRIHKTLPQSSLFGMLLHYQEDYYVVESKQFWVMQHDPFSWVVEEDDFKYLEEVTDSAEYTNIALNQWLTSIDDDKLELFGSTLYNVIDSTGLMKFNELTEDWYSNAKIALGTLKEIDKETKDFVFETIKSLLALYIKSLPIWPRNNKKE